MDILDFARLYCSDLHLAKKTKAQFGVLAFDLGEVAPDPHPPERRAYTEVKERISDTGPSGPWIVQNRKWSPVETLVVQDGAYALDRQGDYRADTYGRRETICSERWLLGGLAGYLKPYFQAFGRFPLSVSVYTVMTPCPACNSYLRRFPTSPHNTAGKQGGGATIGKWYLAYSTNYDFAYADAATGDRATSDLGTAGWVVRKDE